MSGFELEPVDGGTSVPLPEGETQLGRGPFLGVSDKRVSRNHGLLEVADGQLRIKPTHQNPCFYQPSLKDPPEPLERDRWHPLEPGNLFSLLPGKYIFRVVYVDLENTQRNSQCIAEEEPIAGVVSSAEEPQRSPELNGQCELAQNNSQNQLAESTSSCVREKEEDDKMDASASKEQESVSREQEPMPEQRKRMLPSWMMQTAPDTSSPSTSTGDGKRGRGKAPPSQKKAPPTQNKNPPIPAKQPRPRKTWAISLSSQESENSEPWPAPKRRAKRLKSEEEEEELAGAETATRQLGAPSNNESDEAASKGEGQSNGGLSPKAQAPERKTGAGGMDGGEESQPQDEGRAEGGQGVGASTRQAGPSKTEAKAPPRPPCPYGKECYRKNPVHFQECSHPGDQDYTEGEDEEKIEEDDNRPECPYGTACYRKNPLHKKEYKHTQDPGRRGGFDEDDDGDEDGSYDDSFINDDSEDLDEDSDYVPEEEDVERLTKEAKAFMRRKR
ncbi:hypothetical protein GJAV_G00264460 [Gymnothorax javanicus]|nr:hypothetical protein GJAV_G00264460 [Gymnothorax javanicus]